MRSRRSVRAAAFAVAGLLAGALLAPSHAEARRIFVPKTHKTLQAAIDAASPGDTLWVSKGVYRGPFVLKKNLLLFADAGPESTFLDGGDSVRVLHVEGVNGGGLVGFGIRGGKAAAGGGVYCVRDTLFTLDYCTLSKNWESGVAFWQCSQVKVSGCTFTENKGSALQLNETTGYLMNSRFIGNSATGGAALYMSRSEMVLPARNNFFEENRADETVGGAVLADSSRIILSNCLFRRNSSAVAGGAVAAVQRAFVSTSRCEFIENHAAQGGALHADRAQFLIGYSLFVRNTATAGGAAIGVLGRFDANVNPIFTNNTFYKNSTNGSGATVFAVKSSPEIRKNIFVVEGKDQLAVAGLESAPLYECNLIHDPSGAAIGSLPSSDSLVGDPLFCDPAKGDFSVRDLSPAIRAACGPVGARPVGCKSFQVQPAR
ncbi:MAG TPA: right-handed parallel beta-helix repeat-containing protein [Candidatus Eisenbacteria bacterium]|nr:right-handed parallel beta-helix repeat-containing protein [Candidatus Eisenbacteria bacterium]